MSNTPSMPTNDVFREFCIVLRIHKEKDYIVQLFANKGWDVSKAKIHAWTRKAGAFNPDYRPMPEEALRDFIDAYKLDKERRDKNLDI
ncbi:DUF1456 family protein [Dickeya dadantii]|uniref:DUF1456 family protein n=1 Tax=Dickeya dadantii TaxID=204038 RepID=UPI001CF1C420|nr:DUF1456 family protein [Dickeya dadantii]MCA7012507.1 DUF1456 family protein [Dickeya dadantii]